MIPASGDYGHVAFARRKPRQDRLFGATRRRRTGFRISTLAVSPWLQLCGTLARPLSAGHEGGQYRPSRPPDAHSAASALLIKKMLIQNVSLLATIVGPFCDDMPT